MRRRRVRVAVGLLLLVLAVGVAFVSHGVAEAASAFRHTQAQWQRGLVAAPAVAPGPAQRAGEALLGIRGRSEVLRAYQDYSAELDDVIAGTVFPQTRARSEAIGRLLSLRSSLGGQDRASADIVLGVIFAASAATAGQQRQVETKHALDAFRRAVLEDPANDTAKRDLELLLRSELDRDRARAQARGQAPGGGSSNRRARQQDPRGPTVRAQAEGSGY